MQQSQNRHRLFREILEPRFVEIERLGEHPQKVDGKVGHGGMVRVHDGLELRGVTDCCRVLVRAHVELLGEHGWVVGGEISAKVDCFFQVADAVLLEALGAEGLVAAVLGVGFYGCRVGLVLR